MPSSVPRLDGHIAACQTSFSSHCLHDKWSITASAFPTAAVQVPITCSGHHCLQEDSTVWASLSDACQLRLTGLWHRELPPLCVLALCNHLLLGLDLFHGHNRKQEVETETRERPVCKDELPAHLVSPPCDKHVSYCLLCLPPFCPMRKQDGVGRGKESEGNVW